MTPGPLPTSARDPRLDALRGLALFGVLVMNLPHYTSPFGQRWVESMIPGPANLGGALLEWLGHGKLVAILAGLYGYGFARRSARLGDAFVRVELRRLGFLAALGVAHALVWPGDILVAWALAGLCLLALRRVPAGVVIVGGFALPALLLALGYGDLVEPLRRAVVASHARSGIAPLVVAWGWLPGAVPQLVAQARIGVLLARWRPPAWVPWVAGTVGLALAAVPALPLLVPLDVPGTVSYACGYLGATGVAVAIAALFLRWPVGRLTPVGAMPLTTYLAQTALFVTVVPPRLHAGQTVLLAAAVFAVQVAATTAWSRRYARGPLEALWRRASYPPTSAV